MKQFNEMNTEELVNVVKSMGLDAQSSFGQFVKARALRPEIGMREFRRIWDRVSGVVSPAVVLPFNPTHVLLENFPGAVEKEIEILKKTDDVIEWRSQFGRGGTPRQFIKSLEVIRK
jgi:hypothetical protein